MIILIPIALGLFTVNCYLVSYQNSKQSFRRSFLAAIIGLFFFVGIATEILSLFNLIHSPGIASIWLLLDIFLILWHLQIRKKKQDISVTQALKAWDRNFRDFTRKLGALTIFIICSLMLLTFIVALVAPPNNIDSLTYHLSRLGYWTQNQNVEHYASHIERAISFSPLSEYVHLHTFLLVKSERYFQLVQWLCLAGILGFVSLVTEMFSDSRFALRIALCFTVTLPIVVLEAMTTQNDLVVSFFIIATAFYALDYVKNNKTINLILLAAAISTGLLTKGTFAFYTAPFGIYMLVLLIKAKKIRVIAGLFVSVFLVTFLLNVPFWNRTYRIFNSPIGIASNGNKNHISNVNGFLSSTSKHVFLHLGFVSPQNKYNNWLEKRLTSLHEWLGEPLNSPSTGMNFKMNKLNFNEDFAHNFFGIWIILIGLILLPFSGLSPPAKWYLFLSFASFLTFCFFISYQIYGSRLHIPFFILISPAIGLIYSSILPLFIQKIFVIMLWLSAVPYSVLSVTHPLLSTKWFFEEVFPTLNKSLQLNIQPEKMLNLKQESILKNTPERIIWGDYWVEIQQLVHFVDSLQAQKIGFDFKEDSHDYAYQFVLKNKQREFHHVMVRNPSKILEKQNFKPDCIIAEHDEGSFVNYNGIVFHKKWSGTNRWIYVP